MISIGSAELGAWLAAFGWPLARILAFIASAPILGNPSLPARVKIALGLLITLLVAPLLPMPPDIAPASAAGMLVLAQQILVGLAMGFALHVVFHAAEMAGELIGLQMGLGFATLYDASVPGMIPVVGQFLGVVFSLAFLAVNGHLMLVAALVESFNLLPVAAMSAPSGLLGLVRWSGNIFVFGLTLAMPLLAALLVTNLALAVLTRAAPQLNVFAVGFPLTILVGLLALVLALPYFAPGFEQMLMAGFSMLPQLLAGLLPR
jgi:flagellar biosynthetic protein FliR